MKKKQRCQKLVQFTQEPDSISSAIPSYHRRSL